MVKKRFHDFPAAILLIAEIVFDKETHPIRISRTYTRAQQGSFPTNRTLSREQVFVPEGNSNSSPSGAVGDHQWTVASCTNFG